MLIFVLEASTNPSSPSALPSSSSHDQTPLMEHKISQDSIFDAAFSVYPRQLSLFTSILSFASRKRIRECGARDIGKRVKRHSPPSAFFPFFPQRSPMFEFRLLGSVFA